MIFRWLPTLLIVQVILYIVSKHYKVRLKLLVEINDVLAGDVLVVLAEVTHSPSVDPAQLQVSW